MSYILKNFESCSRLLQANIILSDLYFEKVLIPLKIFVDRISKYIGIMISRKWFSNKSFCTCSKFLPTYIDYIAIKIELMLPKLMGIAWEFMIELDFILKKIKSNSIINSQAITINLGNILIQF